MQVALVVSVRAKNACGWGEWQELPFDITELPLTNQRLSSQNKIFKIYPNPSSDFVFVDLLDASTKPNKNSLVFAELFDVLGIPKGKINISDNKATIDVKNLNKGVYIVKIKIDDKEEGHQLIIQ